MYAEWCMCCCGESRHLAAHAVAVGAGALYMPNVACVVDIADDVRGVFGCKPDG